MKQSKTVLLSICLLVYPLTLLGYGATGHARQQLRLIAADLVRDNLTDTVMRLRLPDLPLILMEGESPDLRHQLDVLVSEGLMERDAVVGEQRELTPNGWVQRTVSGYRYFRRLSEHKEPIYYGSAELFRVGEIIVEPKPEGRTQAVVHFQWRAEQLDEWVWAPAFDEVPKLVRVKESPQKPISATVVLQWRQQQWVLSSMSLFGSRELNPGSQE